MGNNTGNRQVEGHVDGNKGRAILQNRRYELVHKETVRSAMAAGGDSRGQAGTYLIWKVLLQTCILPIK